MCLVAPQVHWELEARQRMMKDIKSADGPTRPQQNVPIHFEVPAAIEAALSAIHRNAEAPSLAIVYRRMRRWHKCHCAGPSSGWRTLCGDPYNPTTMDIQCLHERQQHERRCAVCFKEPALVVGTTELQADR